jgi:hypothetical protein
VDMIESAENLDDLMKETDLVIRYVANSLIW